MGVEFLTDKQISNLKEHVYKVENFSIAEKYLDVYWDWLVQQVPTWWARNAISTLGLALNVFSILLLVYYSPDGNQDVPSWVLVLCAVGLFAYQSMDNIDGRQARRNYIDGPLDEVFDHGCDAVSGVCIMVGACVAGKMGQYPYLFLYVVCLTELCFYVAHWRAYVTDTVRFDIMDVTESQLAVVAIFLLCAIDDSFLSATVPVLEQPLRLVASGGVLIMICVFMSKKFWDIWFNRAENGLSSVTPAFPIGVVLVLQVFISKLSTIYLDHPCLYMLSFGLLTAKMTTSLVVAHMTLSDVVVMDTCLVGPLMLLLNQISGGIIPETSLLWIMCIYNLQDLLRYDIRLCQRICDILGMYCFSIEKKPIVNGKQDANINPLESDKTK